MDAWIGAQLCVGVVGMYHSGLGGGGFALIRTGPGQYTSIDYRETAPAARQPVKDHLAPGPVRSGMIRLGRSIQHDDRRIDGDGELDRAGIPPNRQVACREQRRRVRQTGRAAMACQFTLDVGDLGDRGAVAAQLGWYGDREQAGVLDVSERVVDPRALAVVPCCILGEGNNGKRMRTTRAARSAFQGSQRSLTRREKWFTKELNVAAALATGGQEWPRVTLGADDLELREAEETPPSSAENM